MVKLLEVIKKNFKILIRSKSSGLIILFGPLLLILLVGTAFNTSAFYGIKIGSYSENYNELSDSILQKLEQDQYKIYKTKSEESCVNGVKTGVYHICAIVPANLEISDSAENTIAVYVDQSRINLVFAIKGAILDRVSQSSKEISESLTSIIVTELENSKNELKEDTNTLMALKESNELFTSNIYKIETELAGIDLSLTKTVPGEILNRTKEVKEQLAAAQIGDTRKISEIEDLTILLKEQLDTLSGASKLVSDIVPQIKQNAIQESSQLVEIERTANRIISNVDAIAVKDVETLVSPIKTSVNTVSAQRTHVNYLFPTLIMMVVMFVALLLSCITVIREKISSAYFRNYISPTRAVLFIFATFLTNILIIIMQLAIVLSVMLFIQPEISATLLNIGAAILMITTAFILLGMIVGYTFNSEETATIGSISLGTILLFFSNTIIPLEALPSSVQNIASFNMFVVSDTILRNIIIFGAGLKGSLLEIKILLVHIAVFIVAIAVIYNISSKMFNIKKYLHK